MNEDETMLESEESVATDEDIFAGWGDDEVIAADDSADVDVEPETDDEDIDEEAEDEDSAQSEPEETEVESEESEPETETEKQDTNAEPEREADTKLFHLKHLGEEVDVDESKVVELAQKGMEYDHIRGKVTSLEEEIARLREGDAFLNELAAASELTIEELIDTTRARMLVSKEKEEGRTMGEAEAMKRVQRMRKEVKPANKEPEQAKPEEQPQKTEEQQRQERSQQIISHFVQKFPDLDPKSIPKDVLMDGFERGNLVEAVLEWKFKNVSSENEKLKLNEKNKERSTGSRKTTGKSTAKNPLFAGWGDE